MKKNKFVKREYKFEFMCFMLNSDRQTLVMSITQRLLSHTWKTMNDMNFVPLQQKLCILLKQSAEHR